MEDSGDDIVNFVISKSLAKSCKEAHKRYAAALGAKREEEQKSKADPPPQKKKTVQEQIKEMKQQKISLEASILYLREKADKLAFESEKVNNLGGMKDLITESNVLEKSAIEKERNLVITKKYLLNLWQDTYKKREHWRIIFLKKNVILQCSFFLDIK